MRRIQVAPSDPACDRMQNAVFERRETPSLSIRTSCALLSRKTMRNNSGDMLPRLPCRTPNVNADRPPQMIRRSFDMEDEKSESRATAVLGGSSERSGATQEHGHLDSTPKRPRRRTSLSNAASTLSPCDNVNPTNADVDGDNDDGMLDPNAALYSAIAQGQRRALLDSIADSMDSSHSQSDLHFVSDSDQPLPWEEL